MHTEFTAGLSSELVAILCYVCRDAIIYPCIGLLIVSIHSQKHILSTYHVHIGNVMARNVSIIVFYPQATALNRANQKIRTTQLIMKYAIHYSLLQYLNKQWYYTRACVCVAYAVYLYRYAHGSQFTNKTHFNHSQ